MQTIDQLLGEIHPNWNSSQAGWFTVTFRLWKKLQLSSYKHGKGITFGHPFVFSEFTEKFVNREPSAASAFTRHKVTNVLLSEKYR